MSDEVMRKAIDSILAGKVLADDSDDSSLPPVRRGEEVLFVLEDEYCRKLWQYVSHEVKKDEEKVDLLVKQLRDCSTVAELRAVVAAENQAYIRAAILGGLFWGVVREMYREEFQTYSHFALGIRQGWMVVISSPSHISSSDLFGLGW